MNCKECGAKLLDGAKFCSKCGSAIVVPAAAAGGGLAHTFRRFRLIAVGTSLAVLAVIAFLVIFLVDPFGSPKSDGGILGDAAPGAAMYRGNPARTGEYPGPGVEGEPDLLWRFKAGGRVVSTPTVVGGVAYVGSEDGNLYALDAATGEELWHFETKDMIWSSPAVVDGVVFVGSFDHNVYALDAGSGQELWRFETDDYVTDSLVIAGGVVYFGGDDGNIYALGAATGREVWRFEMGPYASSSPTVSNDLVYFVFPEVEVLDQSGAAVSPGPVYAVDAMTGSTVWMSDTRIGGPTTLAATENVVYVGHQGGAELYALDARSGKQLWSFGTDGFFGFLSDPAVARDTVYIWSDDGNLYALHADSGAEIWRVPTGEEMWGSPVVVNGIVYVGSDAGNMYALDAATGDERWRYQTDSEWVGLPAVVGGVAYFAGSDGYVYAVSGGERNGSPEPPGRVSKSVSVVVNVEEGPPPGFEAGPPETDADTVLVTGTQDRVTLVTQAVATLDLSALTEDVMQVVRLEPRDSRGFLVEGASLEPPVMNVSVEITQAEASRALVISPTVVGTPAAGYDIVSLAADPPVVTVFGPESVVGDLATIRTQPVDIEGATGDVVRTVSLDLPADVSVGGGASVMVTVQIEPAQGRRTIGVTAVAVGLDPGLGISGSLPLVEVVLLGDPSILEAIEPNDIAATVNLAGLNEGEHTVSVSVSVPVETSVASVSPEEVEIRLEKR